jgi:hypothetical protein
LATVIKHKYIENSRRNFLMIIDGLELMVYYIDFKIVYSENYENFHNK